MNEFVFFPLLLHFQSCARYYVYARTVPKSIQFVLSVSNMVLT